MFREWRGPEHLALSFILYPRVLSQAFKRQPELRTLITHSTPSGEFLLRLPLTISKSGLFDFLAINHFFRFQLLIFRWAVPSLALAYPFPPHWPFSALNFQAQPQVPCTQYLLWWASSLLLCMTSMITTSQWIGTPTAKYKIQQTDEGWAPACYDKLA